MNKTLQETEKTFEYSIENLENGIRKLILKVAPEVYSDEFKSELRKAAKTVRIKGFRPGKVPTSYVKKLLGKKIISDLLSKLIEKSVDKALKDEENLLVGPFLTSPEEENKKLFDSLEPIGELEFKYQITEDFDLESAKEKLKGIELPVVELTEEDKEILLKTAQYRLKNKLFTSTEEIEDKDAFWAYLRPVSVEKGENITLPEAKSSENEDATISDPFSGMEAFGEITFPLLITKEDFPELYEKIRNGKLGETEVELPLNNTRLPFYIITVKKITELYSALKENNKAIVEVLRDVEYSPFEEVAKKIKEEKSEEEKSEEELINEIKENVIKDFQAYTETYAKNSLLREWNERIKAIASEISLTEEMLELEAEKHKDHHHADNKEIAEEVTRQFVIKKLQDKYAELKINQEEILEKTRQYLASLLRIPHLDDKTFYDLLQKSPFIYNQILEQTYAEQLYEFIKKNFATENIYNYYDFFNKYIAKPYEQQ